MAIIGNNTGGGLLNQGTVKSVAKAAPTITVSQTFDKKPQAGILKVGEVGTYKDSKGKDVYVVGTLSGGLTKGTSSASSAAKKLNSVIKQAEAAQVTNLAQDNKIEIIELRKTLAEQGLTKDEINSAIKQESTANNAELKQAKGALKVAGYQTLARDTNGLLSAQTVTNTTKGLIVPTSFNASSVKNADGTMGTNWNSLSYSGKGADAVKQNIVSTLEDVNKLKINYGLNNDVYTYKDSGKTQSTTGISNAALYSALRNGNIVFNEETQNFNLNPDAQKIENALIKDGGKGFQRIITGVLARDTAIGDKAFVGTDAKGNLRVQRGQDGEFMGGKLVDSGQTDINDNKIFIHEGGWDTKYNKASYNSLYVQNPDGSFTYMGTPDVGYTHIDKQKGFSLGGFLAQAALSVAATSLGLGPLASVVGKFLGVSDTLATSIAGALIGGGVSALKGSDLEGVLTDSLLAGIGTGVGDVMSKAANYYGGWTNLSSELFSNPSGVINSLQSIATAAGKAGGAINLGFDAAGNIINKATNTITGSTQVGTGVKLNEFTGQGAEALATTGDSLLNKIITETPTKVGGTTAGDVFEAQMGGVTDIANQVNLNPITTAPGINQGPGIGLQYDKYGSNTVVNPATGSPYAPPGVGLQYDSAGNVIGSTGTGVGSGVSLVNPDTGALVSPPTTTGTTAPTASTGLLDSIQKTTGLSPWQQAALVGGGALTAIGVNQLNNLLNPEVAPVTKYPDVNLNPEMNNNNMLGMPDWWNNLYSRGGFGAGNYLGYDILRGLNVPADVQSLLGTNSGQNTGSSLIA